MLNHAPYIPLHNDAAGMVLTRTNLLLSGTSNLSAFDDITNKVSGP
jgi:hypothetical protein